MSVNLLAYSENISTEFTRTNEDELPIKAIKTDGVVRNLKQAVNMGTVKTCDYISFRGHKRLWMIECTDLNRQADDLDALIAQYADKTCAENPNKKCLKKETRSISKKLLRNKKDALIKTELHNKCIGTSLLVHHLLGAKNIFYGNRFSNKKYLIVTNTIKPDSTENKSSAVALNSWRIKLEQDLNSGLKGVVDAVKIVTPERLSLLSP